MKLRNILIFLVTLFADTFVCYTKAVHLNNVYANNFIKLYFIYMIAMTLIIIIAAITMSLYETKLAPFKVTSTQLMIIEAAKMSKEWFSKLFDFVLVLVVVAFAVFGCWWFFSIEVIKGIFTWYLQSQMRSIAEKLVKENPELKPKEEEKKSDPKLKFKFIKSI